MAKTIYVIDGHSQIYRAYYAPFRDLTSPTGEPTRATYVFCSMMLKFLSTRVTKDDCIAMAVDGPSEKLERRKIYSEYKITRKPTPEDFHPQARRIIEIVKTMGIPVLDIEGHEADDIMATIAAKFASKDHKVVLVSRDKDLDQLVNDNVVLYDPMKDEMFDAEAIESKKGYTPDKAVEIQTLMGDSTDNIPGIAGVGPKTAVKLINKYGTAEAVVAHAEEQTPKLKEKLLEGKETLKLSRQLVTLNPNVPMDLTMDDMQYNGIAADAVRPVFEELGFKRLVEQLDSLPSTGGVPSAVTPSPTAAKKPERTTASDFEYACIDTVEKLDDLVAQLKGVTRLAVDTETTSTSPTQAELVGISLAWEPGKGYYIPVRGPLLGAVTLDVDVVVKKLGPILANKKIEKIGQNIKYDLIVLSNAGFTVAGKMFDTMLAAYCLDSNRGSYKMDLLSAEYLNHHCIPITDIIGTGKKQVTMDTVPVEIVTPYAAEDADVTFRLAQVLEEKLQKEGLLELFANLEMPLMNVLEQMERTGIIVDPQTLKRMETEFSKQCDVLRDRIIAAAGRDFNPDSPKQLAQVLFEDLKLPVIKKGKTGPSTDMGVLEELAAEHDLPALILDYRKLTKLLSTYIKSLAQQINARTGRVHTSFHQTGTATGRLSSSDPNLQNIPIRTEEGRRIRSAFLADKDCVLLSADYSQVELRMLAHLCKDEKLIEAFKSDQDIHRTVAAEVFDIAPDDVSSEQRSRAKTVNFGIIYGQTAHGLARTLRISRTEAGEFIKKYRHRFPKIDEFLSACVEQAKKQGYVETIFHRRRQIPDIDSRNPQKRALAERLAINSVVQGSAADLIKQAMINLHNRIVEENRPSRMLLQIHDELVLEVPESAVDSEKQVVIEEMSKAIELSVPLKVDVGIGKNWMEAK